MSFRYVCCVDSNFFKDFSLVLVPAFYLSPWQWYHLLYLFSTIILLPLFICCFLCCFLPNFSFSLLLFSFLIFFTFFSSFFLLLPRTPYSHTVVFLTLFYHIFQTFVFYISLAHIKVYIHLLLPNRKSNQILPRFYIMFNCKIVLNHLDLYAYIHMYVCVYSKYCIKIFFLAYFFFFKKVKFINWQI